MYSMTQVIAVVDLINDYRFEHSTNVPFTLTRTSFSDSGRLHTFPFIDQSNFLSNAKSQKASSLFITRFPVCSAQYDIVFSMGSSNITSLPRHERVRIGYVSLIFMKSQMTIVNVDLFYYHSLREIFGQAFTKIN